jgi:hypothetical protein
VKKMAAVLLAAAGAAWAFRRSRADQAEADLWAEATDPIDGPSSGPGGGPGSGPGGGSADTASPR